MKTSECTVRKCFQFGAFHLDVSSRTLLSDGKRLSLPSKALDTLVALVEHRGEVLDKQTLMDLVWPDTAVEENNLAQSVGAIRKALGKKGGDQRYVLTVPGRGYCFVAPVTELPAGVPPVHRRKAARAVLLTLVALFVVALVWLLPRGPAQPPRLMPLTGSGGESSPAFSPDGNRIAYVWRQDGGSSGIYLKVIGAGDPMPLVTGNGAHGPAWSPDGRYIAYYRNPPGVYLIPALGGAERLIASTKDTSSRISWSPDGRRLAIAELDPDTGFRSIFELIVETGERRRLTSGLSNIGDRSPAFSPDGKTLGFVRYRHSGGGAIYLMPAAGGEPRQLTQPEESAGSFDWSTDGREIVYSARKDGFITLLRVPVSGGSPQPMSAAGYDAGAPVIARSGNRLAFTTVTSTINLWRIDFDQPGSPRKLAPTTRRQHSPQYSPDGRKLVFSSNRMGWIELWTSDSEGHNLMQLTSLGGPAIFSGTPRWSPDGFDIVFDSRLGGNPDIYVVSTNGGAVRRTTSDSAEDVLPSFSHDGRWIYFSSDRSGEFQIWKVPRAGGGAVQVTAQGGVAGLESVNGRYVYYINHHRSNELWRVPVAGGPEERAFAGAPIWRNGSWRGYWGWWTVSADGIFYIDREPPGPWLLKRLDPANGSTRTLATIPRQPPLSVACLGVSPDGRSAVYAQVETPPQSIMLLENFR